MSRAVQVKTLKGETFSIDVAQEALVRDYSVNFVFVSFVLFAKAVLSVSSAEVNRRDLLAHCVPGLPPSE